MDNTENMCDEIESICPSEAFQCKPEQCKLFLTHHKNSLKILHLNIRSIQRNFNDAMILLTRLGLECDIIVFTECWLSKCPYTPIMSHCSSYRSGFKNQNDGIVIYIKSC